jgi:uncharacterized protein YabE (DUF348 family)
MLIHMETLISKVKSNRKWAIMSIAVLVFFLSAVSVSAYHFTKNTVYLTVNGEEQVLKTHANTVKDLLVDNGIDYNKHDLIKPGLNAKINADMKVLFKQSKEIKLTINGETEKIYTVTDTIKELFAKHNIAVGEHDLVEPDVTTEIKDGLEVNYESAFKVILNDGGKEQELWATSMTVADFLKQHEIKLNELDRLEPGKDKTITAKTNVMITRVEKVTDVVEENVDYAVVKRKDSSLPKGTEKVLDSGTKGKVEKRYEVVLENGKEVSRKLIDTNVLKESEDRVVAVGTKVYTHTVSRGAPDNYSKELYVQSSAYTAYCDGCSGYTSWGGINLRANPDKKVIAVDPRVIPLGSKVWVEGYGYAIAADQGSAIKGNKIDVFFPSRTQALNWGRKSVVIRILD